MGKLTSEDGFLLQLKLKAYHKPFKPNAERLKANAIAIKLDGNYYASSIESTVKAKGVHLKLCADCPALIKVNAQRCKPCSQDDRLKRQKNYNKSFN